MGISDTRGEWGASVEPWRQAPQASSGAPGAMCKHHAPAIACSRGASCTAAPSEPPATAAVRRCASCSLRGERRRERGVRGKGAGTARGRSPRTGRAGRSTCELGVHPWQAAGRRQAACERRAGVSELQKRERPLQLSLPVPARRDPAGRRGRLPLRRRCVSDAPWRRRLLAVLRNGRHTATHGRAQGLLLAAARRAGHEATLASSFADVLFVSRQVSPGAEHPVEAAQGALSLQGRVSVLHGCTRHTRWSHTSHRCSWRQLRHTRGRCARVPGRALSLPRHHGSQSSTDALTAAPRSPRLPLGGAPEACPALSPPAAAAPAPCCQSPWAPCAPPPKRTAPRRGEPPAADASPPWRCLLSRGRTP